MVQLLEPIRLCGSLRSDAYFSNGLVKPFNSPTRQAQGPSVASERVPLSKLVVL